MLIEKENLVKDLRYEIIQNNLCDAEKLELVLLEVNKISRIDDLFLLK